VLGEVQNGELANGKLVNGEHRQMTATLVGAKDNWKCCSRNNGTYEKGIIMVIYKSRDMHQSRKNSHIIGYLHQYTDVCASAQLCTQSASQGRHTPQSSDTHWLPHLPSIALPVIHGMLSRKARRDLVNHANSAPIRERVADTGSQPYASLEYCPID
jgi:hypothetical protein